MTPPDQPKSFSQQKRIDAYMRILEEDPESRVFAPLSEILAQCGDLDEARQVCVKGIHAHPDFSDGRLAFARVLFLYRKYQEALREIRVTLKLDKRKIQAYLLASEIHLACGQPEKIREPCMKVLELDPENIAVRKYLKIINHDQSDRKHKPDHKTDKCIPRPTNKTKVMQSTTRNQKVSVKRRVKLCEMENNRITFNLSDMNGLQAIIDNYSMRGTSSDPVFSNKALRVPRKKGPILLILLIFTISVATTLWYVLK